MSGFASAAVQGSPPALLSALLSSEHAFRSGEDGRLRPARSRCAGGAFTHPLALGDVWGEHQLAQPLVAWLQDLAV